METLEEAAQKIEEARTSLLSEKPHNYNNYNPMKESDYWNFPVCSALIGTAFCLLESLGIGSVFIAGSLASTLINLHYQTIK
jgi:hypothetical protein